ncbi:HSF-type DNA-binding-domain-containing protein [Phascolomyces articulosus]|uniref:HSF-type DNA-binding-domain-containing protein n=1 Tax=Phascolomyces articulosus TaxID=60185 RepID=A0AAD5PGW7_9FUNG|nr:HSF-type DNA-binding-domain-containing protein [Phascolomyces articulosus]
MEQHQWHRLPPVANQSVSGPESGTITTTSNSDSNSNNNIAIPEREDEVLRCQPFITKLLSILEDENNRNLISWSLCGDFFRIYDCDEFSRVVLPRYFRHCNWTSFVRQLNMYDFHKLSDTNLDPENWKTSNTITTITDNNNNNNNNRKNTENNSTIAPWEFKHENFHRNSTKGQLSQIKRKKPKDHTTLHIQYADTMRVNEPCITSSLEMVEQLENQLGILSSSFDGLVQDLAALRSVVELQNKTISSVTSFVQKLAQTEPRESNPPCYEISTQHPSANKSIHTLNDRANDSVTGVYQQQYFDRSQRLQPIMTTGIRTRIEQNIDEERGSSGGGDEEKESSGEDGIIIDKIALKSINQYGLPATSSTKTPTATPLKYLNLACAVTTINNERDILVGDDGLSKNNPSQQESSTSSTLKTKKRPRSPSPLLLPIDRHDKVEHPHEKKGFALEFILQKNPNNNQF